MRFGGGAYVVVAAAVAVAGAGAAVVAAAAAAAAADDDVAAAGTNGAIASRKRFECQFNGAKGQWVRASTYKVVQGPYFSRST